MTYTFCNPTQDQLFSFWSNHPDLLPCIFPTRRYAADNIGPCYPGNPGRFNPDTQKLTMSGLGVLAGICHSGEARTTKIDGLAARDTGVDQTISNIVGMCLKPVDRKLVLIDFDFPIASLKDVEDCEALDEFIESAADKTFASRGNRARLMLVFRQSETLFEEIEKRVEKVKKMILCDKSNPDEKIEISMSNGGQANIAGLHKSGGQYLNHFPESGEIATMDLEMFDKFIAAAAAAGFEVKAATTAATPDSRIDVDDAVQLNQVHLSTIAIYLDMIGRVDKSYTIPLMDILPSTTRNLVKGVMTYNNASKWYFSSSGRHLEGCRRDTSWQVLSDLSSIRSLLIAFKIPFNNDDFYRIVDIFADKFEEDYKTVVDIKLPDGDWKRGYKWSKEYIRSIWREDYIDNPRFHSVNEDYSLAFINIVQRAMARHLQRLRDEYEEYAG